jgi:hypothetical protein
VLSLMPKAKKPKSIRVRQPMDPQRMRAIRRVAIHASAAVMLIGACAVGLHFDRRYVERKLAFPASPPKVVIKNRPVWMSDFVAEQIARTAQPWGTHSAFDHQLLVDTVALLKSNAWVRDVHQVRRVYGEKPGDTLELDCDFRAPIALVRWGEYYWLVDGQGVKLPEAFTQQQVPQIVMGANKKLNIRIVEGVKLPPPESGAKWVGEDLLAGLDLVKVLFDRGYTEEIVKVDVSNFGGRRDRKEAELVLVTKYSTEIRWGRPVGAQQDFFVEVPTAQKLDYLKAIFEEKRRVDGNHPWIDIRFDAVTYPLPGTARTAQAQQQAELPR